MPRTSAQKRTKASSGNAAAPAAKRRALAASARNTKDDSCNSKFEAALPEIPVPARAPAAAGPVRKCVKCREPAERLCPPCGWVMCADCFDAQHTLDNEGE